jgi:hypothetical protein
MRKGTVKDMIQRRNRRKRNRGDKDQKRKGIEKERNI